MKATACAIGLLVSSAVIAEEKCDCTTYPFQPNPPCYGICVDKLSADKSLIKGVKNADAGVLVGISVLSESRYSSLVDFKKIESKEDLEHAALNSMQQAEKSHDDVFKTQRDETNPSGG